MKNTKFETLDECIECYGRENLVAIDCLPQIIYYVSHGFQPCFIYENQVKPGKLTCWYLKAETAFIFKKWTANKPK